MIAIDTNILVRILIDDPGQPEQVRAARALAGETRQVFVPLVVQVETVWVMESAYKILKAEIIRVLEHLETNTAFVLEDEQLAWQALRHYTAANADYADCLILAVAERRGVPLYTFDKRLARLAGTTPLRS